MFRGYLVSIEGNVITLCNRTDGLEKKFECSLQRDEHHHDLTNVFDWLLAERREEVVFIRPFCGTNMAFELYCRPGD